MRRIRLLLMVTPVVFVALGATEPLRALQAPGRFVSAVPFFQPNEQSSCRDIDRSFIQFDASLSTAGFEAGQVLSLNDGSLALLLIVSSVNDQGAAAAIDFATSIRIGALIIRYAGVYDVRVFDPSIRSGAGLKAPEDAMIDAISFCYRVSIPSPPEPATTAATSAGTPQTRATVTPEPTAAVLTLDLSAVETARAHTAEIEVIATKAAIYAAGEIATSQTRASAVAATATSASAQSKATIAALNDELATSRADLDSAKSTAAALRATLTAPTATLAPTETPTPTETVAPPALATSVVYATSGVSPFAGWQPVDGWDLTGATAKTDGLGQPGWVIVPAPSGLLPNVIVDIEFRITGDDICPGNFGVAVRGSESGYYAAGFEWACDPVVRLWANTDPIASATLAGHIDPLVEWHHLQLRVIGSEVRISLNDVELLATEDDRYQTGSLVAFWADGVGLEIRFVQVSEITP